ncbi:uncharacterized protein BYT42DRAFT_613945 [Radiomyces spectabilis]|uniref:uncharacterized protein n=1 Tax=Radiomyces spectabilis TaxID=64574 RepID=UPI0022202A39|nr:uncharacterized protein BYT42DRAFT_613945 [Radiomyces spectabilis]KAI8379659.1 hypothetical protein BYT42DRAFT_613945 [Radiomyces spectabilis]
MASNHYLMNWDLVCLAFFGKNAIGDHHLGGNISIYIVAPSIVFYLIKLQSDGMYAMTELLRANTHICRRGACVPDEPARLRNVIHVSRNTL